MLPDKKFRVQLLLIILALVVLCLVPFLFTTGAMREFYISEGGPIQIFSAAGYLIVVATLVRELSWEDLVKRWYFVVIPLAMCFREMDFHAHFTTYNITKTTLYVSKDVPLYEKVFGASVFFVLGFACYSLIRNHVGAVRRSGFYSNQAAVAVLAAMICVVLSKMLDGAASNLAVFGISIDGSYLSVVFEEVLELGIPLFLMVAAFSAFPRPVGGAPAQHVSAFESRYDRV